MNIISRIFALLFGIFGAAAILLSAYAHHAGLEPYPHELLNTATSLMIPHALLGLFVVSQHEKISGFSFLAALFVLLGFGLFVIPVVLMAFGYLPHTPTAPFGGVSFAISWLLAGIGLTLSKESRRRR